MNKWRKDIAWLECGEKRMRTGSRKWLNGGMDKSSESLP